MSHKLWKIDLTVISDDLLTKTVYKIEAKPQAVIYPHNPRVSVL